MPQQDTTAAFYQEIATRAAHAKPQPDMSATETLKAQTKYLQGEPANLPKKRPAVCMDRDTLDQIADALQITSGCSPIESDLAVMPDDQEKTLTFCGADLKQIRNAMAVVRALQGENSEHVGPA